MTALKKLATLAALALLAPLSLVTFAGCATEDGANAEPAASDAPDEEMDDGDEAVATSSNAVGSCYCAQPYTCGHSTSPSYMYPAAHTAIEKAGVKDSDLLQTFGDAPASVGTHCPEPGQHYSAATDVTPSAHPCDRVHDLRMQGFAAWYRVPPSFGYHIHAVYAGTPVLKSSLKNQITSFTEGRNGLVSNAKDTICPITSAEIKAVENVRAGKPAGGGSSGGGSSCEPGGFYCGGDKVAGSSNTLYRCDAGGKSATKVRACAHGCSVNPGEDDSCKCSPGGEYCGGDVIDGDASTLYRCGSDGVSTTKVKHCANGCAVHSGTDDSCK